MKPLFPTSAALVLIGALSLVAAAADREFAELARHVPDSANALVLVNVQKLFSRPLAKQEGWRDDVEKRIAGGLSNIPNDANQLLLAAQLDFRSMKPAWQVGLVQMDTTPALATLARQHGGMTDTVGSMPGVRLPDDSYLVRFSEHTLGGLAPGDRQAVSRWIRGSGRRLSAPLQEAVGYADAGAEIIMALDLSDVAALTDVQQGIEALDGLPLENANLDLKELARLLAGVKSLMLGVTFDKRAFGKIKLEFDRDVTVPPEIVKPLLLGIVAQRGLMIDEFDNWKAEIDGRRIMFGGYLTSSGLTRLSSLVDLPTPAFHNMRDVRQATEPIRRTIGLTPETGLAKVAPPETSPRQAPPTPDTGAAKRPATPDLRPSQVPPVPDVSLPKGLPVSPPGPTAIPHPPEISPGDLQATIQATRRYFRSTGQLIGDLRGRKRDARTVGQIGQWYEIYARRVDRLPLLHVDDQMVGYGGYVANQFRNASLAVKGTTIESRAAQVAAVNQGASMTIMGTKITRGLTVREDAAVRTHVRTMARASAAASYRQIETEIDGATAEIRAIMTKKYQTEM